jgi:site-specific DNA recombinase
LTLNVLLSFAQFEREVTGERIRDKIAASKKKGMWMGGNPPLGYNARGRMLIVNPAEAETVRHIFALYREFGCVRWVKQEADRLGLRTKRSTTGDGAERGAKPFSRGHLYSVLSNPIYSGRIAHKGQLYPGQHPALIDDVTWTAVRERIDANGAHRALTRAAEPSLLTGLLVDVRGERLTPSHAIKKSRRYRYYVSAALITGTAKDRGGWRLPAEQMEQAVLNTLTDALAPAGFVERFALAGIPGDQIRKVLGRAARVASALRGSPAERLKTIRDLVEQVVVSEEKISIKVRRSVLSGEDIALGTADDPGDSTIEVATAVAFSGAVANPGWYCRDRLNRKMGRDMIRR